MFNKKLKKVVKAPPQTEEEKEESRNVTYEFNHVNILDAFNTILKEKKRKPTLAELSSITELSVTTVQKHLTNIKFEPQTSVFRMLTDNVILAIYKTALGGSSRSQELFLQLVEGWAPTIKNKLETDPHP